MSRDLQKKLSIVLIGIVGTALFFMGIATLIAGG